MSFLWHGLTEQGAQVPIQVDAEGRVIAVDGTTGVSNWDRTNGVLSPLVPTDSVDIGSGNISLDANGSAFYKGKIQVDRGSSTENSALYETQLNGTRSGMWAGDGSLYVGTVNGLREDANIALNASDGTASFAGNITAPNVTFRSADPQFYVKKSKHIDALPEYVGPELDLLAEIARLEALVRNLYETLRITPPAGWPVWDGNDDVLRQLRK